MRICYLADASNVHTQKWARFFVERGNEVHVISFRSAKIPDIAIYHIRAEFNKFGYLLKVKEISRLIQRISPDLLHAHHATSYGLVGALSDYHPYLISSWGSDVVWSPRRFFPFRLILRYNFGRANRVTATSRMLAKATAKFCPSDTTVRVIPFGVDTDVFTPKMPVGQSETDGPLTVGIVKTLRPRYGIRELVLAFRQISNDFSKARLVIVGGGERLEDMRVMVNKLGLDTRVILTGQVNHREIPDYLHTFDLFVVPSLTDRESFGVAAVEAAACGLPVIASRVGGLPEVVQDDKTGILVPPGDIDALASAMSHLINDPTLRTQMGQAGRQFVVEHYRWEDNARLMEQLYYEVLDSHSYG